MKDFGWVRMLGFLGAGLGAGILIAPLMGSIAVPASSPDEIQQDVVSMVRSVTGMQPQVIGVSRESGVYVFHLDVGGNRVSVYATLDGKYIFPIGMTPEQIRQRETPGEKPSQKFPKTARPEVILFVMSFCPYGNQAEEAMKPVYDLLGDRLEWRPAYIYSSGQGSNCERGYCSLHGIPELRQNVREMCVFRNYGMGKWMEYVNLVNQRCSLRDVEQCWKSVADQAGIDFQLIEKCFQQDFESIAAKDLELSRRYDVYASPTLIINGVKYQGPRTPEGYKQAICSAFTDPPVECEKSLSQSSSSPSGGCPAR